MSTKRALPWMVSLLLGGMLSVAGTELDVCVYGATSGGIAAAIQAKRMGKTVVLLEPGKHVGGLTTGGLGATDIGNKAAIGGMSREFYERVAAYYSREEAWKHETRQDYFTKRAGYQVRASGVAATNKTPETMWTFEPHVATAIYRQMLEEAGIIAELGQELASVKKRGATITEIRMRGGQSYRAKMFIDATYEGDLMAKARVSYHVGREANSKYNERLNGVREHTPKHQFTVPVDPYKIPGNPKSGLLPFIMRGDPGKPGSGDHRVQAYNYRLCFTTNAINRMALEPPPGYDAKQYELLGRYLEALVAAGKKPKLSEFWNPIWMPNGKTDINNNGGFSTDFIGANYEYPEASFKKRALIAREHENYTRAFLTFLATDARVPENMRKEMKEWGPCKDEFQETGGWPSQLYVREARRLVGEYVMTEHDCRGTNKASDPVGLGAYNMDSHNCNRIVKNGKVENEGDVQEGVRPYPISYRSLIPKARECVNLFVPVCLSASHIAYGSIRMEPVFMILGQSAATAASIAIDDGATVQTLKYEKLKARLLADKQVLEWTQRGGEGVVPSRIDPKSLQGIVIDDADGVKTGSWLESGSGHARRVGTGYIHDNNDNKGETRIVYTPDIPAAGEYELIVIAPPHANRATNVPVKIVVNGQEAHQAKVNQRLSHTDGFFSLGKHTFPKGRATSIVITTEGTDGFVVADGIQLIKVR